MAQDYEVLNIRTSSIIDPMGKLIDVYEVFATTTKGDNFMVRFPTSTTEPDMRAGLAAEAKKLVGLRS
jgi:hypothetical protein